jgi:hypothetical protein
VDLSRFRSLGEVATNTQVTSQLQNSVPSESTTTEAEAGVESVVENKSTKEDEEGELSCS